MAGGFSRTAAPWTADVLVHGGSVQSDSVGGGCGKVFGTPPVCANSAQFLDSYLLLDSNATPTTHATFSLLFPTDLVQFL